MAIRIVERPVAQVLGFPKAKKRGRKVTKGPKAEVHVIYELVPELAPISMDRAARIAELLVNAAKRREAREAHLDASPNVHRFPENRRVRTHAEIDELKAGRPQPEFNPNATWQKAMALAQQELGPGAA